MVIYKTAQGQILSINSVATTDEHYLTPRNEENMWYLRG